MWKNTDQKNPQNGRFLRSVIFSRKRLKQNSLRLVFKNNTLKQPAFQKHLKLT